MLVCHKHALADLPRGVRCSVLRARGTLRVPQRTLLRGDANTTTKHERDQRDTIAAKHTHGAWLRAERAVGDV
jgi:hypothetical protein